MKKYFLISLTLILIMLCTIVNAGTFYDTKGLNCEFAVDRISYLGIVNGTSSTTYAPNKTVTRAELSKMIVNVLGSVANSNNGKNFSDIQNHWGKDFIIQASNMGILNGYSDGTFKPDKEVPYAEAITIIVRALGYNNLENSNSTNWYDNYILKMKEINLDSELGKFNAEDFANRGDIAILVWNMIANENRLDSNGMHKNTLLEERFSKYNYIEDVRVMDVTSYAGRVIYGTAKGKFYVDENIDFADLGGKVTGFYDKQNLVVIGLKIDEGITEKKISGSLKAISEMGYAPLKDTKNIYGYGDKVHAEYVEIFVDEISNEILRVVYYDTRESYFAEQIKIGNKKITIESKNVYDQSIVQLKDGKMITYNILRTECVQEIDKTAVLVYDGKVVDWESMPSDSVLREITDNQVYTYTHRFIDGKIERDSPYLTNLIVNGKKYIVAEDAVCQNVKNKETMKLKESLTHQDISTIAKNDKTNRVYLNEFDEIVKLEFEYDVWKINSDNDEDNKENEKTITKELNRLGFVVGKSYPREDGENSSSYAARLRIRPLDSNSEFTYEVSKDSYNIGDFVYLEKGKYDEKTNKKTEDKFTVVSKNIEISKMKIVLDSKSEITERGIGNYKFDDDTRIIEVALDFATSGTAKYSKCKLNEITFDKASDYTRYRDIYIVADSDNVIWRVYLVKELGTDIDIGIINSTKSTFSGDVLINTTAVLATKSDSGKRYYVAPIMGYSAGDIVTYTIEKKKGNVRYDYLVVDEVYRHELIGSEKDLVVSKAFKNRLTIEGTDDFIDLSETSFEIDGTKYEFDDFTIIDAKVEYDKQNAEWKFTSINTVKKDKVNAKSNTRIVINEITNVIVFYNGFRKIK